MSRILDFILGIFTFADPVASGVFYLALILIPLLTWFLGKNMPQKGPKIMGLSITIIAVVLGLAGIGLLFVIGGSSNDINLEESLEIDGKSITEVQARSSEDNLKVIEGSFFEKKNYNDKQAALDTEAKEPSRYTFVGEDFYEKIEVPEGKDVQKVFFKDGTSKKVVDGAHWDQGTVGLAIELSMIIVYICFGLMLGYGLSALIQNPRRGIKPLILVGGLLLVFVIGYALEGSFFSDLSVAFMTKMEGNDMTVTNSDQADAGGGIIITIILIVLAVLAWVGGEVYKLIR